MKEIYAKESLILDDNFFTLFDKRCEKYVIDKYENCVDDLLFIYKSKKRYNKKTLEKVEKHFKKLKKNFKEFIQDVNFYDKNEFSNLYNTFEGWKYHSRFVLSGEKSVKEINNVKYFHINQTGLYKTNSNNMRQFGQDWDDLYNDGYL